MANLAFGADDIYIGIHREEEMGENDSGNGFSSRRTARRRTRPLGGHRILTHANLHPPLKTQGIFLKNIMINNIFLKTKILIYIIKIKFVFNR